MLTLPQARQMPSRPGDFVTSKCNQFPTNYASLIPTTIYSCSSPPSSVSSLPSTSCSTSFSSSFSSSSSPVYSVSFPSVSTSRSSIAAYSAYISSSSHSVLSKTVSKVALPLSLAVPLTTQSISSLSSSPNSISGLAPTSSSFALTMPPPANRAGYTTAAPLEKNKLTTGDCLLALDLTLPRTGQVPISIESPALGKPGWLSQTSGQGLHRTQINASNNATNFQVPITASETVPPFPLSSPSPHSLPSDSTSSMSNPLAGPVIASLAAYLFGLSTRMNLVTGANSVPTSHSCFNANLRALCNSSGSISSFGPFTPSTTPSDSIPFNSSLSEIGETNQILSASTSSPPLSLSTGPTTGTEPTTKFLPTSTDYSSLEPRFSSLAHLMLSSLGMPGLLLPSQLDKSNPIRCSSNWSQLSNIWPVCTTSSSSSSSCYLSSCSLPPAKSLSTEPLPTAEHVIPTRTAVLDHDDTDLDTSSIGHINRSSRLNPPTVAHPASPLMPTPIPRILPTEHVGLSCAKNNASNESVITTQEATDPALSVLFSHGIFKPLPLPLSQFLLPPSRLGELLGLNLDGGKERTESEIKGKSMENGMRQDKVKKEDQLVNRVRMKGSKIGQKDVTGIGEMNDDSHADNIIAGEAELRIARMKLNGDCQTLGELEKLT
ncbi:unnamed protein product [Protopolystoma xenopodis]|uniref:Uncharacterized protein n=1 Tax=Protopolystoma xenopodis TaxID=117903 RepID=A0A448WTH1_9PLAT|nr:unnamed protein product [Protopolystoma xenopodis]